MKNSLLLAFFAMNAMVVCSQIVIDVVEPQYLPAYNFLGPDYTVSNVDFVGHPLSYGQFDGTNCNLGLDKGFMICTGDRSIAYGPNKTPDEGLDISIHGSSPLMNGIGISPRYDGTTLSFDFQTQLDSISFRFVFASEEYKEFVGSQFNDVMAIYIEGPGIPNPVNIGTLPNSDVISINSVHPALNNQFGSYPNQNGQYFVDNPDVSTSVDQTKIGYDGFTQGTAVNFHGLLINGVYRLTFSIADVGDGIYDSALFVEACETCDYTLGAEVIEMNELSVYPNPLKGEELHLKADGQHTYRIMDITGKEIQSGEFTDAVQLEMGYIYPGTYLVLLDNGTSARFIKQ
ncbi:MAG: T9SS type A sorting domain-containing protein [bacterium]|nr:T9SS type A sorting domain-containing protein [bacterium]